METQLATREYKTTHASNLKFGEVDDTGKKMDKARNNTRLNNFIDGWTMVYKINYISKTK